MKHKPYKLVTISAVMGFLSDVRKEFERSTAEHGLYNSAHEGFGVLYEEVDELWDEVRKKRSNRSKKDMYTECVQIASCALKFALAICKENS